MLKLSLSAAVLWALLAVTPANAVPCWDGIKEVCEPPPEPPLLPCLLLPLQPQCGSLY
jgi:hypothetical protein